MKHKWEEICLGDILINRSETPDDLKVTSGEIPIISKIGFKEAKIELRKDGVSNTKLIKICPNDFIISGINVEKGAIAINKNEFDIAATIHYSTYFHKSNKVDLDYLWYFCRSKEFKYYLKQSFPTGIKTEIKPKNFLKIEIPLPPLEEQQRIVAKIESIRQRIEEIRQLRKEQEHEWATLLFSRYTEAIAGAEWIPMREVAPMHRRPVEVQLDKTYNEVGARSFGRGVFEKPAFKGSDLTWQKPYWIKAGDFLLSNVKAWEGAVSLVPPEYDGWVGSHRYITCLPNQELINPLFLDYYFKTQEGVESLSLASAGTADRNRTLNTKMLAKIKVPVPTLPIQQEFVSLIHKVNTIRE
jgi:type I restriction enzyme S subunit